MESVKMQHFTYEASDLVAILHYLLRSCHGGLESKSRNVICEFDFVETPNGIRSPQLS